MIAVGGAAPEVAWLGLFSAGVSASATALCTWLFARWAERRGWVDDGSDAPARKFQGRAVAPVGGWAILCGCALGALTAAWSGAGDWPPWLDVRGSGASDPASLPGGRAWILLALLSAFAVGLCDDLKSRGLSPLQKLAGQMLAAAWLAVAASDAGEMHWGRLGLWFVGGVVAQNALNTFDNADGAATAVAGLGIAAVAPLVAAALAGFLPFNLWIRRTTAARTGAGSVPLAYLGDSGSHAVGLLLLLHPQTRLALCLPLLDLARVALARMRRGIVPWIGDRRHLAHRMQDRGWSPTAIVAALCLIASPLIGAGLLESNRGGGGLVMCSGALGTILLFAAALHLCPARD